MVSPASLETDSVKDSVRFYGSLGSQSISDRLAALEDEPELETVATLGLAGAGVLALIFGMLGSRLWRLLAWMVLPLIFAHARGRLAAPGQFLKTLGLRSRKEIEEEKYALKALRGDFRDMGESQPEGMPDPASALDAVRS
ncbi:MAG: hypothetical protein JF616_12100 [Fibrobacteres bacterium]|nr:hypothetical protein [Fibrobacterota bacterium]